MFWCWVLCISLYVFFHRKFHFLFFTFSFFSIFTCCKNHPIVPQQLSIVQVDSIVSAGLSAYSKNPLSALPFLIRAGNEYHRLDRFDKAANAYLNVAGIYEEHTTHIDSAIMFAERSLLNYQMGTDSMQIANLYKYYGYLIGMNGDISTGKTTIDSAIGIYRRHGFEEGIAVSQYNLARLAFHSKKYDNAVALLEQASMIWKKNKDPFRLFLINQLRLETGIVTSNKLVIDLAIRQNDSILLHAELPDTLVSKYQILKEKSSISPSLH